MLNTTESSTAALLLCSAVRGERRGAVPSFIMECAGKCSEAGAASTAQPQEASLFAARFCSKLTRCSLCSHCFAGRKAANSAWAQRALLQRARVATETNLKGVTPTVGALTTPAAPCPTARCACVPPRSNNYLNQSLDLLTW